MKSAIHFLNDFFVQNGYFRSKDGEQKGKTRQNRQKIERKEREKHEVEKERKVLDVHSVAGLSA